MATTTCATDVVCSNGVLQMTPDEKASPQQRRSSMEKKKGIQIQQTQTEDGMKPYEVAKYLDRNQRSERGQDDVQNITTSTDAASATLLKSNHTAGDISIRSESNVSGDVQIPEGFAECVPQVFRCAYPHPEHFKLLDALGVRTVINLLDQFPDPYKRYIAARDIRFIHIPVAGNKESCRDMDETKVQSMLRIMCDATFHPVMIHCRSGKHRTGCIIGCLRTLQGWNLQDIYQEYTDFAKPKERDYDMQFIRNFNFRAVLSRLPPDAIPSWVSTEHSQGTVDEEQYSVERVNSNQSSLKGEEVARKPSFTSSFSAEENGNLEETPRSASVPVGSNTPTPFTLSFADNDAYEFVRNDSSSCDSDEEERDEENNLPDLASLAGGT